MSALPPIADVCSALAHVRFGPKADIDLSFNHLIGASGSKTVNSIDREDNDQQKIPRHIVNRETRRHDGAYSVPGGAMITIPELASEALGSYLAKHMGRRYGSTDAELIEIVQSAARLAIDCIGNSDALYHNVEHTMMVTLCGYDILTGRRLLRETNASDFAHVIVACLYHDIGYVRGILNDDSPDGVIDAKGNKTELSRGSSDAALMPYHVDRSKLYVMHRLAKNKL